MLEEIEILESEARKSGIAAAHLYDLPQVVILVGKNGAGKTRYLRQLQSCIEKAEQRTRKERQLAQPPPQGPDFDQARYIASIQDELSALGRNKLREPQESDFIVISSSELPKPTASTYEHLSYKAYYDTLGIKASLAFRDNYSNITNYILKIAMLLYLSRHPDHASDRVILAGLQDAQAFNEIAQKLIGTRVGYIVNQGIAQPLLFDRPFSFGELSPGQRTLLAWAISLHSQTSNEHLAPSAIIAVDEPEAHLHPAAHIDVLERLYQGLILGTGRQLWLATHSPSVVAHFAPRGEVYLVENNAIVRSTTRPARAIDGLLGGEGGRGSLQSFLNDDHATAFYCFVAQCVHDALVSNRSTDRQSNQFAGLLRTRFDTERRIRILDYASGKGRFAKAIADTFEEPSASIDLVTFDDPKYDEHRPERLRNLRRVYPNDPDYNLRCSNDISDFYHERRVDVVVMANFLHEVNPHEWIQHFQKAHDVLADNGALAIFEDQRMSVGELPNLTGYIVLSLAEMRRLIGSSTEVTLHPATDNRCSVITISKTALYGSTQLPDYQHRLITTLLDVHERSMKEIGEARSCRDGYAHARAVVQIANVATALSNLGWRWNGPNGT